MTIKTVVQSVFLCLLAVEAEPNYAQISSVNTCVGANAMLSLVNRPSMLDSVCTVPEHEAILEVGYAHQNLLGGGTEYNLPQAVFRYGLPDYFEFAALLPNYYHQSVAPTSGFGFTSLAIKHELMANEKLAVSLEGLCAPPSGSRGFGSQDPSGAVNGIINYNFTEELSTTIMLGVSSISQPILEGGGSYKSFNPIALLSWTKDKVSVYTEVFAQTKTGVFEGAGVNMDMGILYLVRKNITIDFSLGHRISGNLGGYNHYLGFGGAFLWS